MSLYSCGQPPVKSRGGLTGNNIVELIQDKNDKEVFTDPIDDTTNFKKVVDNIYIGSDAKIYILTMCFRPVSSDTLLYSAYFKDMTKSLELKSYRQIKYGFFQSKGIFISGVATPTATI